MNVNHTEKGWAHAAGGRKTVTADHGCFPFRMKEIKRIQTMWRNKKFREDGWNLKDQKDSKKETSQRLTKHHEPNRQRFSDVNLMKARLINDVRYQEWTEMTLDCNKMFLESDRKQQPRVISFLYTPPQRGVFFCPEVWLTNAPCLI